MLKAIETVYRGYRFRSRLEARWAVFFNALNVRWEYEKEGFDLGPAGRYLPDFWLPERRFWFEVKGEWPNKRECDVAQALAESSECSVYVSVGQPMLCSEVLEPCVDVSGMISGDVDRTWPHRILHFSPGKSEAPWDDACWWGKCLDCGAVGIGLWGVVDRHKDWCVASSRWQADHDELKLAIIAARQARFEYGESPP